MFRARAQLSSSSDDGAVEMGAPATIVLDGRNRRDLRRLWARGDSCSEIGALIGTSKKCRHQQGKQDSGLPARIGAVQRQVRD
jgi:hypothetical protein